MLRDQGEFLEYLSTGKGGRGKIARDPAGVVMAADLEDLVSQVRQWRKWRRSVTAPDVAPDVEPVMCEHGHDVTAGPHMCPDGCDPDRQRPAPTSADVEPDNGGGVKMPERIRQARKALGSGDRRALLALVAADETTPGGVTPSILESAGIGAQNGA